MTSKDRISFLLAGCFVVALSAGAAELPRISKSGDSGQLLVDGKPHLILGGELGNSSAGTPAEADTILPRVAQLHVNTVLLPVAWEQIEPAEGGFDFSILDHWIDTARREHLHLVLLWFGSWKNAVSSYAPAWVKQNTTRFPRAISADGEELEILSTIGAETVKADSHAFAELMKHVKQKDQDQQTVLMVQIENEVGYLGRGGRDRSASANRLFAGPVPPELIKELQSNRDSLSPELHAHFNPQAKIWRDVFGGAANEVFMAWNYARFIQAVAEAGKREYPLPMYANCQLPAPGERAGEYPSGGPHPFYLEVYRAVAPAIDFYSPDIYWPNFEYWIDRYKFNGNAVFIPEARMDTAPYNALYAFGEAKAFGFSPFAIDSVQPVQDSGALPPIASVYEALSSVSDLILKSQASGRTRGLVLHKDSPRPTRTVALGGYLFEAALSRSWPARTVIADDGAMLVLQTNQDEFYIIGTGLTVSFVRDPDTDNKLSGIASIEQVTRSDGSWITLRRLNGDQSNQGRQLQMDPHQFHIYRVVLYSVDRNQQR